MPRTRERERDVRTVRFFLLWYFTSVPAMTWSKPTTWATVVLAATAPSAISVFRKETVATERRSRSPCQTAGCSAASA